MDKVYGAKLTDLVPDDHNANKGTQRGMKILDDSVRSCGAGRSLVVDKHDRIIAGNKTHERLVDIGVEDAIIVESDGSKAVVVKRTDLDLDDERARMLAYYDNRAAQFIEFDPDILAQDAKTMDLSGLFTGDEIGEIVKKEESDNPKKQKQPVVCPECGAEFSP